MTGLSVGTMGGVKLAVVHGVLKVGATVTVKVTVSEHVLPGAMLNVSVLIPTEMDTT